MDINIEDLLATHVSFFQELSHRELTLLANACRERDYTPGKTLVHQGGGALGLVLITEGSVTMSRQRDDGTILNLGTLGAGATIGEQALLEDASSAETITADVPTRAVVLPIWDFRMTLRDFPDLAIHLIAILAQQSRHEHNVGNAS